MSKDSLIRGTVILAVAALLARMLGLVQRMPLQYMLGDSGLATFSIAFTIYTVLLIIATAGIPSALSKLVSERVELGQFQEANRIYRAALIFATIAGIVMTLLLYAAAPWYARWAGDEMAALSIRALAPALLLFPLIAMMRGYFQGRQQMMPNGISQVIEQIMRLVTAIGLTYLLLSLGWGEVWAVAGASFGGVMGSVGAIAVLIYYYMRLRRKDRQSGINQFRSTSTSTSNTTLIPTSNAGMVTFPTLKYKEIYTTIFRISFPIALFSMAVPLIYLIDASTIIPFLMDQIGHGAAKEWLGILTGRAQTFAGIPIILAIALSQSIVPIISSAYARQDLNQVKMQAAKALQLSILSGLPMILFIVLAARHLNQFVFTDALLEYLPVGSGNDLIAYLTITTIFQILMQVSGAILMGLGQMRPLIVHVFIGIAVKVVASLLLAPYLGIYGFVVSSALCFIVMMALNLRTLHKLVAFQILRRQQWYGLVLSTFVICVVGLLAEQWGHEYLTIFPFKLWLDDLINVLVIGFLVLCLYPALLMVTRVVTKEDIAGFPAPVRKLIARIASVIKRKPEKDTQSGL